MAKVEESKTESALDAPIATLGLIDKLLGIVQKLKERGLFQKPLSVFGLIIGVIACYNVAQIGISEQQTLYFHLLLVFVWLGTSAVTIWLYNTWSFSKSITAGEDGSHNQTERLAILKVHAAIFLASAILVFGSVFIYYGKKSDEIYTQDVAPVELNSTNDRASGTKSIRD
jgi:hypothetical protein